MSGACEDNSGLVTAQFIVFLSKGKRLVAECHGEITVDACLSCLFDACYSGTTSIHFNKASESSHGAGNESKQPNTRCVMHGFDVIRGESKELSGDLKVARKELTDKMRPWSAAYYGDLPGILGIAAGAHRFEAIYIARDGASRKLASGSFGEASDAVGLARLAMAAVAYARVRIEDEKWGQRKDKVSFDVPDSGPRVTKTYGEARPLLVDFYAETQDVPGLERGVRPENDMSNSRFLLTPHGCSRKPHPLEARTAMKQIAETVAAIHSKGWAHRDLRWANIVLDCCKEGRRWTVIDCEYAAKVGTPWADSNPPEDGWNEELRLVDPIKANDETVTVHRDYWMLGKMIAELEGIDSDDELAGIGEELRTAVDDTHPDDGAANKARKDGFERLRAL